MTRRPHVALLTGLLAACVPSPDVSREVQELTLNTNFLDIEAWVGETQSDAFKVQNTGNTGIEFIIDPPVLEDPQACSGSPWWPGNVRGYLNPGEEELVGVAYRPLRLERCNALLNVRIADQVLAGATDTTLQLRGIPLGTDVDEDDFVAEEGVRIETDCDDNNDQIFPGAVELCNGVDDDCDGVPDDEEDLDPDPLISGATAFFPDADADGYPEDTTPRWACAAPTGYLPAPAADQWDCTDDDPTIHPLITDTVGNGDRNCDGLVACYVDNDLDGFGAGLTLHDGADPGCTQAGVSLQSEDCDDTRSDVNPVARERCDDLDVDEDCNGRADNAELGTVTVEGALPWYVDGDSDGYGVDGPTLLSCPGEQPAGVSLTRTDCDDNDASVHPGTTVAEAPADGIDQNCDGWELCYPDIDQDGVGGLVPQEVFDLTCTGAGAARVSGDCDDSEASVRPGATERVADGVDQNCDGQEICYVDTDLDGHGSTAVTPSPAVDCRATGVAPTATDCDDALASVNPDAAEVCNGTDDDCNTLIDEADGVGTEVLRDWDADTFGDPTTLRLQCTVQPGYVVAPASVDDLAAVDCNDRDPFIFPGAEEVAGNGVDEDCDLTELCWPDADNDTWGDADPAVTLVPADLACARPGLTNRGRDCDDTAAGVNPAQAERCDVTHSIDEDCNGLTDDADTNVQDQSAWYLDSDQDAFGDGDDLVFACARPTGRIGNDDDCNDADPLVHPGAYERCNFDDDDCDGLLDEGGFGPDPEANGALPYYADIDQDGFVAQGTPTWSCQPPLGRGLAPTDGVSWDCFDFDAQVNPGVNDRVGAGDRNCDDLVSCYADQDADGFGSTVLDHPADDPDCTQLNTLGTTPIAVTLVPGDCDDTRSDVSPAAVEACDPLNVDENCNFLADNAEIGQGVVLGLVNWYPDEDGDGFGRANSDDQLACPGDSPSQSASTVGDCDDTDPNVHPSTVADPVTELPADNIDQDCDGLELCYRDFDNDGVGETGRLINSPDISCTGVGTAYLQGDCDDNNRLIRPGATELPADGVDQNCDNSELCYLDVDRDGIGSEVLTSASNLTCTNPGLSTSSADCDDTSDLIGPGAAEICDGVDNDCNALIDEEDGIGSYWLRDHDEDGFGAAASVVQACDAPPLHVAAPADLSNRALVDCDDNSQFVHPGAVETIANGIDEDCDLSEACWVDSDRDGYGLDDETAVVLSDLSCSRNGVSDRTGDCDDTDATVHEGALELCDFNPGGDPNWTPTDHDCDGLPDDQDPGGAAGTSQWYLDDDGDTWGAGTPVAACIAPASHVSRSGDCNDRVAAIRPGAPEICNRLDDDCDSLVDDFDTLDLSDPNAGASTYYLDADGDGHGAAAETLEACTLPTGYAPTGDDCADGDPSRHPSAPEVPADGKDSDCDTMEACYIDADGDGFGGSLTSNEPSLTCAGTGIADNNTDCDDTDPTLSSEARLWFADLDGDGLGNPNIHELSCSPPWANGWVDNLLDCDDTSVSVGEAPTWYQDLDGDGFGDPQRADRACLRPSNAVLLDGDCDDDEPATFPGNPEACDGIDNDCDSLVDEGVGTPYYYDGDLDGYGVDTDVTTICPGDSPGTTYVPLQGDCDDTNDDIFPGRNELCNGLDDNCDDNIDIGDPCGLPTLVHPDGRQFFFSDQPRVRTFAERWCDVRGYRLAWIPDTSTETFLFDALDNIIASDPFLQANDYYALWFGLDQHTCPATGPDPVNPTWSFLDFGTNECNPLISTDPYVQSRLGAVTGQFPYLYRSPTGVVDWPSTQTQGPRNFVCELRATATLP